MPTQDLISRAAVFFILAEQSFRFGGRGRLFWKLSNPLVVKTATHLPALAAAVRAVDPNDIVQVDLRSEACHPLPDVLPPEAVRWHNRLVAAWEVQRASNDVTQQNPARLALVRLDGCGMPDGQTRPSRLPEWLAEAQKIASGEWRVVNDEWRVRGATGRSPVLSSEWEGRPDGSTDRGWDRYWELEALAALAVWHPAPRVTTPPGTLREWVAFWLERRQSRDPMEKGIAAIALLNLPEADLRGASIPRIPTVELLQQLSQAIQFAAGRTNPNYLFLLDWQPVKGATWPVAEVRNVARSWMEVTRHKNWIARYCAWQQLIRWGRAGSLDICGMDLLPELVKVLWLEKDGDVLWAMAQWIFNAERFTATGMSERRSGLWQLEEECKRDRTSWVPRNRASAWLAGIRLHQAGLASEPPESFLKAWLHRVSVEEETEVLFTLAQWSPGVKPPEKWHRFWNDGWKRRLLDKDERIRQVAAWALLRQSLEDEPDRSLRCVALELWRTGNKTSSEASYILGAVFARFQQVRARLAAGEVPDFEERPVLPAERSRPPLALPPGCIMGREWNMENEKLKMKNGEWRMQNSE